MKNLKTVRQGFSMIELLFVMVILAALAAIAIPSLSSGTSSSTLTSMRSDTMGVIALAQTQFIDTQDYTNVDVGTASTGVYADSDGDGIAEEDMNGQNVSMSKGNSATVVPKDCVASSGLVDGFTVAVTNGSIDKQITYDSCTQGKIQVSTAP